MIVFSLCSCIIKSGTQLTAEFAHLFALGVAPRGGKSETVFLKPSFFGLANMNSNTLLDLLLDVVYSSVINTH